MGMVRPTEARDLDQLDVWVAREVNRIRDNANAARRRLNLIPVEYPRAHVGASEPFPADVGAELANVPYTGTQDPLRARDAIIRRHAAQQLGGVLR